MIPDPNFLPGSLATELAATTSITTSGSLQITGAVIGDPIFDTPNPGDSPFITGSPVGGDAFGLNVDTANDEVFVAYGSDVVTTAGAIDFLIISVEGVGTLDVFGSVSQGGGFSELVNRTASITVVPEPSSTALLFSLITCGCAVATRRR